MYSIIRSIIHAGGESTRLREIFDDPKALAPIGKHTLLWFHLQPLVKSSLIEEYTFTLRHRSEIVIEYLHKLENEFHISISSILEPKPLGRTGSVRLGIENGIINTEKPYIMSNPDDLIPINIDRLAKYASEAERQSKSTIMVMARMATNPFGIGVVKRRGEIIELKAFQEKPELALIKNHFANTGMILFLPEAMEEFKNSPLNAPTNPEDEIIPKLAKQNKVAVFVVEKWISVNYSTDFKEVLRMGTQELERFLGANTYESKG